MGILLIPEEVPYKPDNDNNELYCDIGSRDKSIYMEGAKAQLKKVVEYDKFHLLEAPPFKEVSAIFTGSVRWIAESEWQALLKEVE